MDPLRVALVARPAQGGIRSHLVLLSRHLDRTEFATRLLAPPSLLDTLPLDLTETATALDVAGGPSLSDLMTARRLLSLCRPDEIIHAHGIRAGWICALARGRRKFPFIVTFHNLPPPTPLGKIAVALICRRADTVIAVSRAIASFLPAAKTRVIPNGIEIERFRQGDRDTARNSLKIGRGDFVVGCVARLSREKGVDLLVEAARQCPSLSFVIVGDGPERAALDRVSLRNVRILGRMEDVGPVLKAMDLLVIPSRSEGQGIVALEAFASGCPVLAARVGGLVETIQDGRTGVLFEPDNVAALAGSIERLARDARLRDALRAQGLRFVNDSGRVETMCRSTETSYRAAAGLSE